MTYIRECQALMSLRLLNPTLRDAVLTMRPSTSTSAATSSLMPSTASAKSNRQRAPSEVSNLSGASGTGVDDTNAMSSTPIGIPTKLWKALRKEYNDSQLRAIRSVCRRDRIAAAATNPSVGSSGSPSLCLLQGPPGTGKTKTILGLLSILLAGALKEANKSTKVIAGASLRSTANAEAAAIAARSKGRAKNSEMIVTASTNARMRSDSVTSDGGGSASGSSGSRNKDRPRVLVCAPSNTAVDELVFRIVTQVSIKYLLH